MHKIPHKAIAFGIREFHKSPYRSCASTHLKSNIITLHNAEDILKAGFHEDIIVTDIQEHLFQRRAQLMSGRTLNLKRKLEIISAGRQV